jgi:hypothetical protein
MNETYELRPSRTLEVGDVVFWDGARHRVRAETAGPHEVSDGIRRVPLARLDGTGECAPPLTADALVAVRTGRARVGTAGANDPDQSHDDPALEGLNINHLLAQLRTLTEAGELVEPGLVRTLDSALSRGSAAPDAWLHPRHHALIEIAMQAVGAIDGARQTLDQLMARLREQELAGS